MEESHLEVPSHKIQFKLWFQIPREEAMLINFFRKCFWDTRVMSQTFFKQEWVNSLVCGGFSSLLKKSIYFLGEKKVKYR